MNSKEKKLAKKIMNFYLSNDKSRINYTAEEQIIISRWMAHKIINKDAFTDLTSGSANHKEYIQKLEYPFTFFGEEEINKDEYLKFRNSKIVIVVRDILTVIAFLLSLYLTYSKIFQH